MQRPSNQGGFTVFEIVLLVVVLTLLGGVGYFAYQARNNTGNDYSVVIPKKKTTPTNATPANQNPSPSPQTKSTAGYLVISQWGVMLPVSGVLSDLRYQIVKGNVSFYSPDLYPKYPYCGPMGITLSGNQEATGIGALTRYPAGTSAEEYSGAKIASINGYDYYYGNAQAECVDPSASPSGEQLNGELVSSLGKAIQSLVSD